MDRIKQCGFNIDIVEYVNKGVVYIGVSAGTHIASKEVEHMIPFDGKQTGINDFLRTRTF